MKIIAAMNLKGGAGKTTSAVHLAVEVTRRGLRVLVVDTDHPQNSATAWSNARAEASPVVIISPAHRLKTVIAQAKKDGFDLVIIDTAPRLGPDAVDVANLANLVIVPIKPDPFDLIAVQETIEIIKQAGVPSLLFITCAPPKSPEVAETIEALKESGLPVAQTIIGHRRTFTRAIWSGRAAIEFEPKGKAAAEMKTLTNEVLACLK